MLVAGAAEKEWWSTGARNQLHENVKQKRSMGYEISLMSNK
jgi:hypothetical protein